MSSNKRELKSLKSDEKDDVSTLYAARRGDGVMRVVRRCTPIFARYRSGKIGAKLDYHSSKDEDDAVVVDPPTKVVAEVIIVPDLPESGVVAVPKPLGEKESPKKGDLEKEESPAREEGDATSPRGQKRSRSVFKEDYSEWDPEYLAYIRDKYPNDFPPDL